MRRFVETWIESGLQAVPSLALGAFEVTPLEIAYAYSVFANLGVKAEPISILAVATRDGKVRSASAVLWSWRRSRVRCCC